MNRILVAFDYFSPTFPLVNNQNFNRPLSELEIDNGTYEFFNKIGGYECVPTLTLYDNDLFIYPVRISLGLQEWPMNPEIDILATTSMSLNVYNSICGRNGYLLFDLGNECAITDNVIYAIHRYVYLKKIPLNKVILQTGNTNGKKQYEDYCFRNSINVEKAMNISCLEYFEWMSSRHVYEYKSIDSGIPLPKNVDFKEIKKTFLCLNRVHRWHRVNLFLLWHINNLMDDSYFTINKDSGLPSDNVMKDMFDKRIINKFNINESYLDDLESLLPLKIDEFKSSAEMALLYNSAVDSCYQSSLISVVTETNFKNNDIFNTEKIFKPMVHRQPFILVGPYKALENLRKMGYKTFSEFWDESYDDIEDPMERLLKIVELCSEINSWDEQKKKSIFYKTMINTTHNYELLTSYYPKNMRSNFWHEFRDKKLFPIR